MTKLMLVGAVLLLVLLGWRAANGVPAHLRYRITIELETPDGVRRGTAVQELVVRTPVPAMQPVQTAFSRSRGDAMIIRVGETNYFVSLLTCANLVKHAIRMGDVRPSTAKVSGNNSEVLRAFARARGHAEMDGAKYLSKPFGRFSLGKFDDENDWKTLRHFDSRNPADGIHLRSVLVEATEDPLTRQAVQALPWLRTLKRADIKSDPEYDGYQIGYIEGLSDQFQ